MSSLKNAAVLSLGLFAAPALGQEMPELNTPRYEPICTDSGKLVASFSFCTIQTGLMSMQVNGQTLMMGIQQRVVCPQAFALTEKGFDALQSSMPGDPEHIASEMERARADFRNPRMVCSAALF